MKLVDACEAGNAALQRTSWMFVVVIGCHGLARVEAIC